MKVRRFTGICGVSAFLLYLAALSIPIVTGTALGLVAGYQLDLLFPAFAPPTGGMVSNAIWLFILANLALIGFGTGFERTDNGDRTWSHTLGSRLLALGSVLYIAESAITIGLAGVLGLIGVFWPYLSELNYFRNADYLLFLFWCGLTGIKMMRVN